MAKWLLNLFGALLFIAALAAAATPALAQTDFLPIQEGDTCQKKTPDSAWFLCGTVQADGYIAYTNTGVHNVTIFTTDSPGLKCSPGNVDLFTDPTVDLEECGALQVDAFLHVKDSGQLDVKGGQLVFIARADGGTLSSRTLTVHITAAPPNADIGDAIPFSDARMFVELNVTTEDLGIRAFLDGEPWDSVQVTSPDRRILQVSGVRKLGNLGLTELTFAAHAPSLEELLAVFPEGEYEFRGRTVEGAQLIATADLDR